MSTTDTAAGLGITDLGLTDLEAAAQHWQEHGWVLVDGLVPTVDIDHAVEELWDLYPHPDEFHADDPAVRDRFVGSSFDQGHKFPPAEAEGAAFRPKQFLGHILFPYTSPRLNRLQVHPSVTAFARLAMSTTSASTRPASGASTPASPTTSSPSTRTEITTSCPTASSQAGGTWRGSCT